jgi:hypothetical protein
MTTMAEKTKANIPSNQVMVGIFETKYEFAFSLVLPDSKLNFGVRIKGDFFPENPSQTARLLCNASPIDTERKIGNTYRASNKFFQKFFLP